MPIWFTQPNQSAISYAAAIISDNRNYLLALANHTKYKTCCCRKIISSHHPIIGYFSVPSQTQVFYFILHLHLITLSVATFVVIVLNSFYSCVLYILLCFTLTLVSNADILCSLQTLLIAFYILFQAFSIILNCATQKQKQTNCVSAECVQCDQPYVDNFGRT